MPATPTPHTITFNDLAYDFTNFFEASVEAVKLELDAATANVYYKEAEKSIAGYSLDTLMARKLDLELCQARHAVAKAEAALALTKEIADMAQSTSADVQMRLIQLLKR